MGKLLQIRIKQYIIQLMYSCRFYIYKQKPIGMEENAPSVVSKYEIKFLGTNLKRYAQKLYEETYKAYF